MNLLGLLGIIVLIAANAFFVAVEFALVAVDRGRINRLASEGHRLATVTRGVLSRLSFHLSGAQLGITITSLVAGFLAEPVVAELIRPVLDATVGGGTGVAVAVALVLTTVFQMVLGELIPKNIAIAAPERTSFLLAPMARIVHGVLTPFIVVFNGAANWMVRRLGIEPREELTSVRSLEEIEYLIRASAETGTLEPETQSLLTRTIQFADKRVVEALTPRPLVSSIPADATAADLEALAIEARFTRYPVVDDDLDHVVGIVDTIAVLGIDPARRADTTVRSLMVDPFFVPETRELVDLLADFEDSDAQLAVVVDEHGGVEGVVTVEDVLEEIVGEIDDEYDAVTTHVTAGEVAGVFIVGGTATGDEVSEATGYEVPEGDYETIAGFMLDQLGHIPVAGEEIVTSEGWTLEVIAMDGRRIASIELTSPPTIGEAGIGGRA